VIENVSPRFRVTAQVGRHVWQDRRFGKVVADDVGNVGIDSFVVGNACARGICQRNAAGPIDLHQTGDAQQGIRTEGFGIEKCIVNPAVNDIHRFEAAGCSHFDQTAVYYKVAPFHQFDAHLLR